MTVPSAVERITDFPPLATELLREIPARKDQSYDVRELIASDPSLLEEVVKNARPTLLTDDEGLEPEQILSQVDTDHLAETALTILVRRYIKEALTLSSVHGYWRYTLACAITCKQLALLNSVNYALAYAGGLLHDIGRLALIAAYPEKYANLLVLVERMLNDLESVNVAEYERTLFGLNRFAIAEWLADRWGLPPTLRVIVGKFDNSGSQETREFVETVRAGTSVAHSLGYGLLAGATRRPVHSILTRSAFAPAGSSWVRARLNLAVGLPEIIEAQLLRYSVL